MHRRRVVATVALLAVAGCSGAVTEPPPSTPSLTPVAVPADSWPVSRAGVPDATALVAAHERALANRTVAVSVYEQSYADGVTGHDYETTTDWTAGSTRLVVERFERLDGGRVDESVTVVGYSTSADHTLRRVERPNGSVSYARLASDPGGPFDPARSAQLLALFSAGDVNVANSRSYAGNYRVWAESFAVRRLPTFAGPVDDATVTEFYATVTPAGRVVGYRFEYAGRRNGSAVHGWGTVAFDTGGRVHRPAWHDDAANATG